MKVHTLNGHESRLGYGGGIVQSRTIDFLKMDQNLVNISLIWKSKGLWHTQRVGLEEVMLD